MIETVIVPIIVEEFVLQITKNVLSETIKKNMFVVRESDPSIQLLVAL